ncbi:ferredoxin [Mycobacterium lentiflavum]|uniref:Ferredoxin n=1 Tax=Mycobacterium lentiflavum TaxID=141349 RepID=A0ABY3UPT0_MYCLN|nr:ferredoxin [Mycobacterium lentiflavum]ULP41588.1 ferredoxin [Mycobacterium lentiflavum]
MTEKPLAHSVHLAVDAQRCHSFGLCVALLPHVFVVPPGSPTVILLKTSVDERDRADLEEVVRQCPTQAISIVEGP